MKYSTKILLVILAAIAIILSLINECRATTGQEKFEKARESITVTESYYLDKVKELSKEAIESQGIEIKDMFIYTNYIDGFYTEAHVLTVQDEYIVYEMDVADSVSAALQGYNAPTGLYEELQNKNTYIKDFVIHFD